MRCGSPYVDTKLKIKIIQLQLMSLGYNLDRYGADGIIGSETVGAIRQFQQDMKIHKDGSVGPVTYRFLFMDRNK
ncbi:hypothetical protein YerA41_097 [Yersinia phage YerA41]|nr:hypothetical protein YerA41_097 [Yersinia phage YerA41]